MVAPALVEDDLRMTLVARWRDLPMRIRLAAPLGDDELFEFCAANRDLRIERTAADLARPLRVSWRNHHILHGDDAYVAYLASDSLHVRAAATGAWRTFALPFSPDAPSDIEITTLAPGAWLIDGTDRGAFRFDPRAGTFCALTIPRALQAASTVTVSSRFRIVVGGVVEVQETPDCPPGAPCARPAPRRVADPRAHIVDLR